MKFRKNAFPFDANISGIGQCEQGCTHKEPKKCIAMSMAAHEITSRACMERGNYPSAKIIASGRSLILLLRCNRICCVSIFYIFYCCFRFDLFDLISF